MRKFFGPSTSHAPLSFISCSNTAHTYFRIKFVLPEIIFDPSLILSPHVFLLGLIFADGAFAAPNLRSASQLSGLDIRPGYQQLELLFKPSMLDVPIFRKSVKTGYGYEISPHEPLTYPTLLSLMKVIGLILGLLQPTRPYCLRYNAANEFNQSGEYYAFPPIAES
jgi:hypothetical protein